ncbi:MAG TPA: phytanoyl-CoA dioxygenase family protein, partial [Myxococcota bacterium]|nr:phytanoyl-CoA dioxygenase family protein [Myxococcota bacterium]
TARKIMQSNGFVVLKNSIPPELVQSVHDELLIAVAEDRITDKLRDIHFFSDGEISSAHNLIKYIPSYGLLQTLPNILAVAKYFFGEISVTQFNSSYFGKPKLQGLETRAHQDNAFFCMEPADVVTCWLPVSFARKENGCLYYYPGSHRMGNLEHVPEGNLGASMCIPDVLLIQAEKKFSKIYIELELGDCVIHNALVIHGSEANKSNCNRDAFNFSIASKYAVRNNQLYESYQKKLSSFLSTRK